MKIGYTIPYVDHVEKTMPFFSKAFGLEDGFVSENVEIMRRRK